LAARLSQQVAMGSCRLRLGRLAARPLLALGVATRVGALRGIDITNVMEDPDGYVPWDQDLGRPVQFWRGNYSNVDVVSCERSGDLLFDWPALKRGMASWLREVGRGSNRVMQTYWELIRPVQHSLTNIVAHHNITTSRDCLIGMLAVRCFYLTAQSQDYRETEVIKSNNFAIDWYYYSHKFTWVNLVRSGWASVIFPSWQLVSTSFLGARPELSWVDCEGLPSIDDGGGRTYLPASIADLEDSVEADPAWLQGLARSVERDPLDPEVRKCPVAFAYAALTLAYVTADSGTASRLLDRSQRFIQRYHERNEYTLVNLLTVRWPLWQLASLVTERLMEDWDGGAAAESPPPASCSQLWCPEGGTPNPMSCECETLFPEPYDNVTACIFMVDTRRKSSLRNITSVLNARFWTLAYGINRLYAEDHGYEIAYVQPDDRTHSPDRKVGWAKVKVIIDRLKEYGPERCAYGVSIDTDAYMRTSEPLAAPILYYGLDTSKLILFSQEYHTELRPGQTFINGGFFIVRNTPEGVGLLEEWYRVPEDYPEMSHLKKDNPQGLNLCWDDKIQPRHSDAVVLAPSHLFTAPLGWFVRHNWFKDMRFEQEMMDVLLQRLYRKYGCIMCQNVYDWDDSLNTDPGWR